MKNPYIRNIVVLIGIILTAYITLIVFCHCNEYCCSRIHISSTFNNIIIGLISSALLLILIEIFQFIYDNKIYGYLKGEYSRTIITDIIANSDIVENEKREEDLTAIQKNKFAERELFPIPGSRYVEVLVYRTIGKNWIIKLKYLHHGIYEGIAEYHKYWGEYGEKTYVKFTLTLNVSNPSTGAGSYKYIDRDDYGIYSFQVNENDKSEILVIYQNTIPSGLSEGYEKWKRIIN